MNTSQPLGTAPSDEGVHPAPLDRHDQRLATALRNGLDIESDLDAPLSVETPDEMVRREQSDERSDERSENGGVS